MRSNILYYPTINLPNNKWIRNALLYWDQISSIVPMKSDGTPIFPLSPEVEFLEAEGQFNPISPLELIGHPHIHDLVEEFADLVQSVRFQRLIGPSENWIYDFEIHINKVNSALLPIIVDRGLAYRELDWFVFEHHAGLLYMSLLATYLADIVDDATIPGTDFKEYHKLVYGTSSPEKLQWGLQVRLEELLPIPREDVPYEVIIRFKHQRADELKHFREIYLDFQSNLSKAESRAHAKAIILVFQDKLDSTLADLSKAMYRDNISFLLGSLGTILTLNSSLIVDEVLVRSGIAQNHANIPPRFCLIGAGLNAGIQILLYALKEVRTREKREGSPYAYLYYAQREGVVE